MHYEEEEGRYAASHHPFTAPVEEDLNLIETEPKKVRGQHYDIVLNGVELGGGSIRIHQPEIQKKIFEEVLQLLLKLFEVDSAICSNPSNMALHLMVGSLWA